MAMVFEDLEQKTITALSANEIDKKCNDFKDDNTVRFTQSNQVVVGETVHYINTLFYIPGKGPRAVSKRVKKKTPKPKGRSHVPETQAKWATCMQEDCKRRWKWTHFKMCPNKHGVEYLPVQHHEEYNKIWKT